MVVVALQHTPERPPPQYEPPILADKKKRNRKNNNSASGNQQQTSTGGGGRRWKLVPPFFGGKKKHNKLKDSSGNGGSRSNNGINNRKAKNWQLGRKDKNRDADHRTLPTDVSSSPGTNTQFDASFASDVGLRSRIHRSGSDELSTIVDHASYTQLEVSLASNPPPDMVMDAPDERGRRSAATSGLGQPSKLSRVLSQTPARDSNGESAGTEIVLYLPGGVTEHRALFDSTTPTPSDRSSPIDNDSPKPPVEVASRPRVGPFKSSPQQQYQQLGLNLPKPSGFGAQERETSGSHQTNLSDSLTWVSHDLDCKSDHRPVREISFPTPYDIESLAESTREAIFESLEVATVESSNDKDEEVHARQVEETTKTSSSVVSTKSKRPGTPPPSLQQLKRVINENVDEDNDETDERIRKDDNVELFLEALTCEERKHKDKADATFEFGKRSQSFTHTGASPTDRILDMIRHVGESPVLAETLAATRSRSVDLTKNTKQFLHSAVSCGADISSRIGCRDGAFVDDSVLEVVVDDEEEGELTLNEATYDEEDSLLASTTCTESPQDIDPQDQVFQDRKEQLAFLPPPPPPPGPPPKKTGKRSLTKTSSSTSASMTTDPSSLPQDSQDQSRRYYRYPRQSPEKSDRGDPVRRISSNTTNNSSNGGTAVSNTSATLSQASTYDRSYFSETDDESLRRGRGRDRNGNLLKELQSEIVETVEELAREGQSAVLQYFSATTKPTRGRSKSRRKATMTKPSSSRSGKRKQSKSKSSKRR